MVKCPKCGMDVSPEEFIFHVDEHEREAKKEVIGVSPPEIIEGGKKVVDAFISALKTVEVCVPGAKIPEHCKRMGIERFVDVLNSKGLIPDFAVDDVLQHGYRSMR